MANDPSVTEELDTALHRLHRCLVEAIREARPDVDERPLTIAEIYQDLVPYRAVRKLLGVELNADYEHVVLRLLAGEGGHVRVEPPEAQEELRRELESPNPDVGLFRKFAACDVTVDLPAGDGVQPVGTNTDAGTDGSGGGSGAGGDDAAARRGGSTREPGASGAPEAEKSDAPEPTNGPPGTDASAPANPDGAVDPLDEAPAPGTAAVGGRVGPGARAPSAGAPSATAGAQGSNPNDACAFCRAALPGGRPVRYCPFCGQDQEKRPCPSCGEVLDSGWQFCIACGASAEPSASPSGGS